jgi:hypothetical protein
MEPGHLKRYPARCQQNGLRVASYGLRVKKYRTRYALRAEKQRDELPSLPVAILMMFLTRNPHPATRNSSRNPQLATHLQF